MAIIGVGNGTYEIGLVVFDKDGTLTDLNHIWGSRAQAGVTALAEAAGGGSGLRTALGDALGLDLETAAVVPNGPLAVASMAKLYAICATVLYQRGISWEEAEGLALDHFAPPLLKRPTAEEILPLADVSQLFRELKSAGVKIAVATSDDRSLTEPTLKILGVSHLVDVVVCGDDDLPNKPSPAGMQLICSRLGIGPERTMMVGDSVSDMVFGRNSGAACCVGIVGKGDPTVLGAVADELLTDVGQIKVEAL